MSSASAITVGYWAMRGLGAPLRQMVMYAGVPLNCVMHDQVPLPGGEFSKQKWFEEEKPVLKEKNALINLPYIIDGEIVVTQTNACFVYLGRKLDMMGSNFEEEIECEQLLCEIMDLRNRMTRVAYPGGKDSIDELLRDVQVQGGILPKLEQWLDRKVNKGTSGTFLVGDKASAPDFHLYEMLVQYSTLSDFSKQATPVLANFPRLAFFLRTFEELPGNTKYLNSKLGCRSPLSLPFNNKHAQFGGSLDLEPWKAGAAYEFADYSGVYL